MQLFAVKMILFYLIKFVVKNVDSLQEIQPFIPLNNCSEKQYFDANLMKCSECGPGFVKSENGLSCSCRSTNKLLEQLGPVLEQKCVPCLATEVVSLGQRVCVPKKCFKNANGKTSCFVCKKNQIIVTHSLNSSILPTVECITCSPGSVPSPDRSNCQPCSLRMAKTGETLCECDARSHTRIEDVCVPKAFVKDTPVWEMRARNGEAIRSLVFERFWIYSSYLCSLQNETACQWMANLCVLSLYRNADSSPCSRWRNQKNGVTPPLLYGEDESYSVLWRKKLPVAFSLNENSQLNRLQFMSVGYRMDGSPLEPVFLDAKSFVVCPNVWKKVDDDIFKFGDNYRRSCTMGAKQLLSQAEAIFLEPYLKYPDGEGKPSKENLYAVPVLLRGDLIDFNKENDVNTWQLVRRFFISDSISGQSVSKDGGAVLKYFRYAKSIQLQIRIRRKGKDERNKIFPPLLIVEYAELNASEIEDDADVDLEFAIRYELDGGNMVHGIEIAVGSLSAFATVYSILQSWSHSKRSGKLGLDVFSLLQFLIHACGNLANTFFVVAFGASTYSFILYKTQKVVYALPPSDKDESVIHSYVIVAFSLKIVEMISVNWRQVTSDICFIDWEKPSQPADELVAKLPNLSSETPVSFWRPYFVANEWNEIQILRKICLPLHLVVCIFVLEIIGISAWSNVGIDISTEGFSGNLSSPAHQLALCGLVFLFMYFIQLSIAIFIYERFITNAIQDFMDVCSIANVSVLLLDARLHGYYLHGRCVHASCDTDARGLQPGLPFRAFTVRCTPDFRMYYDRLSIHMASRDIKWEWQHHLAAGRDQVNASTATGFRHSRRSGSKSSRREEAELTASAVPSSLPPALEHREQASRLINKFLTALFDHALEDLDYEVREKRLVEKLLDVELMNDGTNKSLLLYNASGDPQSFQRAIWYGQEWTLITFDFYLFCFVQMMSGSYVLAALVTGGVWKIFAIFRQYAGKKNLARKTLIDERFLI